MASMLSWLFQPFFIFRLVCVHSTAMSLFEHFHYAGFERNIWHQIVSKIILSRAPAIYYEYTFRNFSPSPEPDLLMLCTDIKFNFTNVVEQHFIVVNQIKHIAIIFQLNNSAPIFKISAKKKNLRNDSLAYSNNMKMTEIIFNYETKFEKNFFTVRTFFITFPFHRQWNA